MTTLDKRGVRRETNTPEPCRRRKPLIVLLEVGGRVLKIKEKGTRRYYVLDYATIYRMAVKVRAEEIRQEKIARRKARKDGAS